jgi:1,4-alpha-glucan branching enzyme
MPITADLLERRVRSFVLWCPRAQAQMPILIIGQLQPGNPPLLVNVQRFPLLAVPGAGGLFAIDAAACGLTPNTSYHYWFEVDDSRDSANPPARIAVTDPFACSVDWRIFPPGAQGNSQPAAVILCSAAGQLAEGDPKGETPQFEGNDAPDQLPPNNTMVIYEMPTAWALSRSLNEPERDVATFLDVAAMVDERIGGANFSDLSLLAPGNAYLVGLGINALELLPASDSYFKREWGYDTSHYLAPDAELGFPEGNLSPTANRDLAMLVSGCHRKGIRFFIDAVMAFAHEEPYNHIDAPDFCMDDPSADPSDPDSRDSRGGTRNGFGSTLWRYAKSINAYDPVTGATAQIYPARQLMLTFLTRWMRDFRVDGVRMDSVENVANWDFVQSFKDLGRQQFKQRWTDAGLNPANGADARYLVVGEELSLPPALLRQGRLDALWNKAFSNRVRAAIQGQGYNDNFEWTIRKLVDCRLDLNGTEQIFTDGAQAINYFTSHDVEGAERLLTMLQKAGDSEDLIEKRIKLAFVCLMTAVGIPMFLAGEEFADQDDLFDQNGNVTQNGGKQIDPVNYGRLTAGPPGPNDTLQSNPDAVRGAMRRRIFAYVKALIKLRTTAPALAVNDTNFIMVDFNDNKRVLVWQRGAPNAPTPVIVVANFSDFYSASGTDYVIPNWPQPTPAGKKWREMTQPPDGNPNNLNLGRDVDPNWVGREAIYPWEAKVYTLVNA